jgi:flagellar hook protein FlgE
VSVTSTGSVTAQDVVNAINALPLGEVTASVAGNGSVQITTDRTGAATSIKISAGPQGKDLAAAVGLSTTLVTGTETTASALTALNDLPTNLVDYQPGDIIELDGVDTDGTPVSASFVYGTGPGQNGVTLGDLLTFIDGLYPNATASLDPTTGQISLTADQTGKTPLSLNLRDNTASAGSTSWSLHAFQASTVGTDPDTAQTSIEVYDASGISHTVNFTFERQDDGSWNIAGSIPPSEGTISGLVQGLRFNENGTILSLPNTTDLTITFTGHTAQTVNLELGTPALYDGVTQLGQPASVLASEQDGYGAGELANMAVNTDGSIQGFYTNGQVQTLGQLGIANFVNEAGLREVGNNLWTETPNSGARTITVGAQNPRVGEVFGGALESSNVEIAEEFVRLIEAQRGFQANARVISTTDAVLSELVNLLR